MPRSIDLFIVADAPLEELAKAVAQHTGMALHPHLEDGTAVLEHKSGATAVLAEHTSPDDADLRLSRYRYALSATTDATDHVGDTPEARMLRMAASALTGQFDVLLVVDLQYRPQVATG